MRVLQSVHSVSRVNIRLMLVRPPKCAKIALVVLTHLWRILNAYLAQQIPSQIRQVMKCLIANAAPAIQASLMEATARRVWQVRTRLKSDQQTAPCVLVVSSLQCSHQCRTTAQLARAAATLLKITLIALNVLLTRSLTLKVMPWGTANVGLALMVMMEVTVRPAWQASSKLKRDLPPARNALVASIRMRLQPHVLVCAHHAQAAPTRPLTMLNVVLAQHTRCLMLRVMKCKTANARRATQSPMKTPTPARCAKLAPIKMPLEVRSANSALLARVHRLGAKLWRIASATRALLDPLMVVATCA
mmetsp:Transcript_102251/g.164804  ORF Transcript_102251/g.164804 Transcript_102251/m.164804 type:complete len:303 (-) Transcript_102251:879-1787(-)